jgi:hypothetical protein
MNYNETVEGIRELHKKQDKKCKNKFGYFKDRLPVTERKKYYFFDNLCSGWNDANIIALDCGLEGSIADIFEEYSNDAFFRSCFTPQELAFASTQKHEGADFDELNKEIFNAKPPKTILKERLSKYTKNATAQDTKEIADKCKLYNGFIDEIKQELQGMEKNRNQLPTKTADPFDPVSNLDTLEI